MMYKELGQMTCKSRLHKTNRHRLPAILIGDMALKGRIGRSPRESLDKVEVSFKSINQKKRAVVK